MLTPEQLVGIDVQVARRVIATGRSIAPCIDSLTGEDLANAVAILSGVAKELASASRRLKSQRIGSAQAEYFEMQSAFSDDDRAALRALCSAATDPNPGGPIGSFPTTSPFTTVWPDVYPST